MHLPTLQLLLELESGGERLDFEVRGVGLWVVGWKGSVLGRESH